MKLLQGDCLDILKTLPENSIDSLVTDPPAGISFMSKDWDDDKGGRDAWIDWMSETMSECLRVLKPGAYGLVWSIPRTSHWTGLALEKAGFEVRDIISHLFGQGFPKSLNISKAIDKAAGAERKVIETKNYPDIRSGSYDQPHVNKRERLGVEITAPSTEAAKQWDGWGTALKPAVEMWWLVRKPCSEKTVASNVLKWGTGGINIDGCRIGTEIRINKNVPSYQGSTGTFSGQNQIPTRTNKLTTGRFPANLVLSHDSNCIELGIKKIKLNGSGQCSGNTTANKSMFKIGSYQLSHGNGDGTESVIDYKCTTDCAIKLLDEQSGFLHASGNKHISPPGLIENSIFKIGSIDGRASDYKDGGGGASRFFYCAKISPGERNAGLEEVTNKHPTVKPQKLMRYLCKLITPPQGVVLDPFMGSGSTGLAALGEGFDFIGIEKEQDYFEIAQARIKNNHV